MRTLIIAFFYLLKRDYRYIYYFRLKNRLKWSKEKIQLIQNSNLKKLIEHAYLSTQFYKNIFDENNLTPSSIKSKEDLKALPVLTKKIMNESLDLMKSNDKYGQKLFLVTSGGSTGNQAFLYKSKYFEEMSRAIYLSHMGLTGWKPSDKSVWIWGAPFEHEKYNKSLATRLGFWINNRLLFNAYDYSISDFELWANKIKNKKPKVLFGYASILLEFAYYLEDNGIELNSIKIVVSTTEKLLKREKIEQVFKCKVFDQYGCREIPMIAAESRNGQMYIADDHVIVEIVEGEILLTALHSFGFPLIRYKVGDTGKFCDKSDEDANFSKIDLKIGRITDNFLTKSNRKVSSSAIATYISTFQLKMKEYQIIQKDYDKFHVRIIKNKDYNEDFSAIENVLKEYFGDVKIITDFVYKIEKEKSGKKLLFKCNINK